MGDIAIFSGSAHPELAAEICAQLQVPLYPSRVERFASDCLEVQLLENCRERDVFIVQPLCGASAARRTVVMPFYAYARSDKKDRPRVSLGGRLVADLLSTAGADRILTMTLHAPQVHGFFSVPVDHLHALTELAEHFRGDDLSNTVVVSPDLGNAKEAAAFARLLGTGVAAAAKQRISDDKVVISAVIGDVEGKDIIVLDDEIAKGSSVIELLDHLARSHVGTVRIACTHGLFAAGALDRLQAREDVTEIVSTNTVPIAMDKRVPKLTVLSIAPAFAEAIRRIHNGESVSALFHPA